MDTKTEYQKKAEDFLTEADTNFKVEFLRHAVHFEGETTKRDIYLAVFKRKGRSMTVEFGQSLNLSNASGHKRTSPTAYDVLACLTKYDPSTFEDFCSEFGYDVDSRKAEKVYDAVCKEWANVQKIWSDKEIEALQEIQ